MRVLWFTNTPSNYNVMNGGFNGGGWISSLETEISKHKDIDLAVSFIYPRQPFKTQIENVTYYPIEFPKQNKFITLKNILKGTYPINKEEINTFLRVIDDFKPDIIEIFGSEQSFGLISTKTTVPIILHIQGIINPYLSAYLPPFISWIDFYLQDINPRRIIYNYINKKKWIIQSKQEKEILKNISYYIGRTEWDKRVTKLYNPKCKYFYGSEILRNPFYFFEERHIPSKLTIVTTISDPLYKGFDLILKTANLLKVNYNLDFEWKVFGNINPRFIESKVHINSDEVGIILMGVGNAQDIKNALLSCTCFFHPSYIDNSPNSLCEAQMLGCTVISTNVGGISSLIEDGETGYLIPANDPFQSAFLINHIYQNADLNLKLGFNAYTKAKLRHDKNSIINSLINVYNLILNDAK